MTTPDLKEKQMIITVSPELLDLIDRVEALEREEIPEADFSWSYYPLGRGATGTVFINYAYKEFDVSISENGTISAYFRYLDKWDGDNTETHPFDADYEEAI